MIKIISFILLCSMNLYAKKESAKFPKVEHVEGKAFLLVDNVRVEGRQATADLVERRISNNQILKDKARIKTSKESSVRIKLSKDKTLIISELSEIEIPAILWLEGKIEKLILHDGQVRIICQSNCQFDFESKLFYKPVPAGDYIFSYEATKPSIEVKVIEGEIDFRGYETESEIRLMAGQIGKFEGVFEDGEVAYDVLLKGRKVAKGRLFPVEQMKPGFAEELRKKETELQEKSKKKKAVVARKENQICEKPFAELNQCVYRCLKNKKGAKDCQLTQGAECVRYRCDANGHWTDETRLSQAESLCKAKDTLKSCDY